jgi:hypothetical protein
MAVMISSVRQQASARNTARGHVARQHSWDLGKANEGGQFGQESLSYSPKRTHLSRKAKAEPILRGSLAGHFITESHLRGHNRVAKVIADIALGMVQCQTRKCFAGLGLEGPNRELQPQCSFNRSRDPFADAPMPSGALHWTFAISRWTAMAGLSFHQATFSRLPGFS